MATINPKHYYIKLDEYGKILDVLEERIDFSGMPCSAISALKKRTWDQNFRLYRETEYILKKVSDPDDFTYYPLYRNLGQEDKDFEFNNREEALREYESHIGEEVFCYNHDC